MRSTLVLSVLAALSAPLASASFSKNLNYRSPSEHHPALGIAIHKVAKRNEAGTCFSDSQLKFTHGVASGDPFAHSVILWTRLSPHKDNDDSNVTVSGYVPLYNHETAEYVKSSKCPVCVEYLVAKDEDFTFVADQGRAYTTSDIDYTVKVSVASACMRPSN
jgi:alkaline phosphatase D